jgi:hypothetical protein
MTDYGPNTYVPTFMEAERDIHENSTCTFTHPCPACERLFSR